jgi:hypothetical protein
MTSCSLFAYFLLEAGQLDPGLADAREHALRVLLSYADHSWDPVTREYHGELAPGGAVVLAEPGAHAAAPAGNPWSCSYGDSGLARFGRIAAYAARTEGDARCREVAERCAAILRRTPLPAAFTPEEIGFGIHLALDLYDLEHDRAQLDEADRLARIAVEKLWTGALFRRLPGDRFYEAKLGAGDLAAALLRLSLRLRGEPDPEGCGGWSF